MAVSFVPVVEMGPPLTWTSLVICSLQLNPLAPENHKTGLHRPAAGVSTSLSCAVKTTLISDTVSLGIFNLAFGEVSKTAKRPMWLYASRSQLSGSYFTFRLEVALCSNNNGLSITWVTLGGVVIGALLQSQQPEARLA